ncbi:hypothetical protein DPSP01_006429 [Paraphaeosphaeria sporulosa]|uniref:CFEM domain-containing protein n=1 Tax=Paraphaeosphaeria sporulosa TaxID=1460663 RepID=A0A177BWI2_9PLEO|nr:uncharacterized protein CC84DRAFT_1169885 [Paraphaeosphaeria sporulosa]OAF98726.1 hypothetical protein CC84DRAFT_1169885 [Paraphaeosphaeria sporulosa]
MRFSNVAILFALSSCAVAQDILGSLPRCGQNCFGNNFQGCQQFDYKCICGNKDLIAELSCCVSKNCNSNDQNTIITLASGLCKAYGVDVPTQASCAASASSTASTASSVSSGSASSAGGSSVTTAPATTSASESQSAAAQTSTGSPGAAGPVATAGAGLGLAVGVLLAAL